MKTGSTVTEYSFEAWGRRCDKDDWTYTLTSEPVLFADRGFTGHEYLKYFNLYNMNGRMYDPLVGRFLSADNVIQDPTSTQNYNRYSYCLNNPLKFTDPTGYRMAAADQYRDLGADHFEMRIGTRDAFGHSINAGGADGGAVNSNYGRPGGGNSYSYDSNLGAYVNSYGDIVGWNEVMNNDVVPNAAQRYAVTQTAGSIDGGKTFTGNGNYSLVRLGIGVESTGLYPTFTSRRSGLDFINSFGDCLDPSTVGHNLLWLTYPGGNNPLTYNKDYTYQYVPERLSEYPAIGHDRRYDNLKIQGKKGLFTDTRAIGADWRFVREELGIALNPFNDSITRMQSFILGGGLGLAAFSKTLYQLSQPNGLREVIIWYNISNRGVTNTPSTY